MLKRNRLIAGHIVSIANLVARVHQTCRVVTTGFDVRKARKLFNDIGTESAYISKNAGPFYGSIIRKSIQWNNLFLKEHWHRLGERITKGFKRDVHGDLHCANIFIYRDPIVFDCIEFNKSFRYIDVLYEVAFLCMDLEAHRKSRLAKKFISEYNRSFKCIEGPGDVRIFNYYKCLRANVRAKVNVLGARQADEEAERSMHIAEAKKYLLLMKRYMLT